MWWIARRAGLPALLGIALGAGAASAGLPDLNLLALDWLRGRFASPVVCEVDGEAVRAWRRVVIAPGPRHLRPPVDRLTFHGIDAGSPTRCSDALGVAAPSVHGAIDVTLPGRSRPDLAQTEFSRALRQNGGFDFEIRGGRLRLLDWGGSAAPRVVDFAGGTVHAREVRRGSDAARILGEFEGRKLALEAEAPSGEKLSFHLVLYDAR